MSSDSLGFSKVPVNNQKQYIYLNSLSSNSVSNSCPLEKRSYGSRIAVACFFHFLQSFLHNRLRCHPARARARPRPPSVHIILIDRIEFASVPFLFEELRADLLWDARQQILFYASPTRVCIEALLTRSLYMLLSFCAAMILGRNT